MRKPASIRMAVKSLGVALCLGGLALSTASVAQPPDEEFTLVEELVARAYDGPPWWRVLDEDTTVYIMASPRFIPAGLAFNRAELDRRLDGANELIIFTGSTRRIPFSSRTVVGQMLHDMNVGDKTDLEPTLPPDVRARFVAARETIGQPDTRYGALPLGLAGMALAGDTARFENRTMAAPPRSSVEALVAAQARSKRVPVHEIEFKSMSYGDLRRPGMPCLLAMLDEIEKPGRIRQNQYEDWMEISRAWAGGDIRPMLDQVRREGDQTNFQATFTLPTRTAHLDLSNPVCNQAMPSIKTMDKSIQTGLTNAVRRALRKKGHAVALVPGPPLLVRDGVLDQLRREGFTVKAPGNRGA